MRSIMPSERGQVLPRAEFGSKEIGVVIGSCPVVRQFDAEAISRPLIPEVRPLHLPAGSLSAESLRHHAAVIPNEIGKTTGGRIPKREMHVLVIAVASALNTHISRVPVQRRI